MCIVQHPQMSDLKSVSQEIQLGKICFPKDTTQLKTEKYSSVKNWKIQEIQLGKICFPTDIAICPRGAAKIATQIWEIQ